MGMVVLYRDTKSKNKFREVLIELIEHFPGDELFISSGYFTAAILKEPDIKSAFKNGYNKKFNSIYIRGGYFTNHKSQSNCNPQNCSRTICNSHCYCCEFKNFEKEIRQIIPQVPVIVDCIGQSKNKYHAKIIGKRKLSSNGNYIYNAIIVGSSNLTYQALKTGTSNINLECDIYIWDEKCGVKSQIYPNCSIKTITLGNKAANIPSNYADITLSMKTTSNLTHEMLPLTDVYQNLYAIPVIPLIPEEVILRGISNDLETAMSLSTKK